MAGYSGKPLVSKLGIRDGMHALLIGVPAHLDEIAGFSGFMSVESSWPEAPSRRFDYIHVFEVERARLEDRIPTLFDCLKPEGMLWISWPKKAARVPTTITEDVLRAILLPTGLVDVKVAAVDDVWSALKFVIRKELRAGL